jgi:predicted metal-dependent peptidase
MNRAESLSRTSKDLMLKEPYYGFFLIGLNKIWTDKVPTAGVSKDGINYRLYIGETFWNSLSEDHRRGLLKHELLHIAFGHLTMYFKFSDKKLANIAMDMEINQYILSTDLPEGGIDIDNYSDLNLDRKAGCRYYYEKLKQFKDQKEKNGTCGNDSMDKLLDDIESGNIPDHSTWEEFEGMSEAEQKLLDKQVQRILQDAEQKTKSRGGHVPDELKDRIILDELLPPKFNWKNYIRRFTGVSTKIFTKKTRRKDNVKFPDNPALKIKMRQKMLLAIDTSGSVNNEELKEFMNEIHHIYKAGVDIHILQCDTTIKSSEDYKGKFELGIVGRGGTDFDPVLKFYAEHKEYTSLVYFTDGECSTSLKPTKPVLWVISEQSSMPEGLPGKTIKLEL